MTANCLLLQVQADTAVDGRPASLQTPAGAKEDQQLLHAFSLHGMNLIKT